MILQELLALHEAAKGSDWKVQFKMRSKDEDAWDSGSVVVKDYTTKERAKLAAQKQLLKKYKDRELTITRVTEI